MTPSLRREHDRVGHDAAQEDGAGSMSGGSSHDGGLWGAAQRWLRPRYVWGRIIHNLLPKVLSLVVALTLWFVATADRRANVEQGFDVPVTVRDTTGGRTRRATSDLNPSTVRVTLSGRPERLRELSGETIEAVVDVTGVPEGSFNRPITVQVPGGTNLRRQAPERVQGFVDAQLTRTLAVTLSVASPSDTSLLRYEVAPAQATVSGAGRVVATVRRLITSPAPLLPGEASEVKLIALDEDGQPGRGRADQPGQRHGTPNRHRRTAGQEPARGPERSSGGPAGHSGQCAAQHRACGGGPRTPRTAAGSGWNGGLPRRNLHRARHPTYSGGCTGPRGSQRAPDGRAGGDPSCGDDSCRCSGRSSACQ